MLNMNHKPIRVFESITCVCALLWGFQLISKYLMFKLFKTSGAHIITIFAVILYYYFMTKKEIKPLLIPSKVNYEILQQHECFFPLFTR